MAFMLRVRSICILVAAAAVIYSFPAAAWAVNFVDLNVTGLTAPAAVSNGESLQVSWHVTNQGNTTAAPVWADYLYLSNDTTLDGADQLLLSAAAPNTLDAGTSYTTTRTITLPNKSGGTYYLIIHVNATNSVSDSTPGNDVMLAAITVRQVDLSCAPLHALADISAGQSFSFSWAAQNLGDGKPQASWADYVYLSNDATLDGADTLLVSQGVNPPLDPGTSYTQTRILSLPNRPPGTYYIIVSVDATQSLFEPTLANNVSVTQITTHVADLAAAPLHPLADISAGQSFSFSWAVQNLGDGQPQTSWADYVYFSTDPVLDGADTLLISQGVNPPLDPGTSYTQTRLLTPPNQQPGTYYIIVSADATQSIYETSYANNTAVIPITIRVVDLAAAPLAPVADINAGESIQLKWNVRNLGNGQPQVSWADYVYFSTDTTLDGADQLLRSVGVSPPLDAGTSYTMTQSVTPPNRPPGTYYLIVKVDASSSVYETDENNNMQVIPFTMHVPNLTLDPLPALPPTVTGQQVSVTWNVRNTGDGKPVASWADYVYFSVDDILDGGDQVMVTVGIAPPLDPGTSYTLTRSITIPNRPPGLYYVFVHAVASASVYETTTTDNLKVVPLQVLVPDLKPRSIKVWRQAGTLNTYWATWDGMDFSDGAAYPTFSDYVYLSTDDVLDGADPLLATAAYTSRVDAGGIYGNAGKFTVPANTPDTAYVIVKLNATQSLYESDNTNNTIAVQLYQNAAEDWSLYK